VPELPDLATKMASHRIDHDLVPKEFCQSTHSTEIAAKGFPPIPGAQERFVSLALAPQSDRYAQLPPGITTPVAIFDLFWPRTLVETIVHNTNQKC
jgi:hypothetical protein